MFKKLCVLLVTLCLAPVVSAADLPKSFNPDSRYRLEYKDMDTVLKGSVLHMGPSTHQRARTRRDSTGSKINLSNPLPSRFEGNRIMFHLYNPTQIEFLGELRDDLLKVAQQLPLEQLSKNGQLAYWYNLHNAMVLAEIARLYPVTDLEPFFDPENNDAFHKKRQFNLNGTLISPEDIEQHVLKNWTDPVVIYGFYMGAVGTPNLQSKAFSAATVYEQLTKNAVDFVNSVRGTELWRNDELRVSTYYTRMQLMFPNFDQDVLAHIKKYANPDFLSRLGTIQNLEPQLENWYIADIYNGHLNNAGGSYPITSIDNIGRATSSNLPTHVRELLVYRREKLERDQRNRNVGVEEIQDLPE